MDFDEALAATGSDGPCKITLWLDSLDETNRIKVLDALETLPSFRVYRISTLIGLDAAPATWQRHTGKLCKCYR